MIEKQTAGRDVLGEFAPKFAELNDDVLFGQVWAREDKLSLKMRSIVTITALISKGVIDSSLNYHLETARKNGVTKTEMAELLTHLSFYAGWPNAWAAFRLAKEVYVGVCQYSCRIFIFHLSKSRTSLWSVGLVIQ